MKKIILLMPLMALTALTSCGKPFDPNKIDLYKKAYVYESDGKTLNYTIEYTYNEQNLVAEKIVNYDTQNEAGIQKYSYLYDEHETLKEETYVLTIEGQIMKTETSHWTNEYDNQGRLIHTKSDNESYSSPDEIQITYGDHTKLETRINKDPLNNASERRTITLYTYNDKGHIINEKQAKWIGVNEEYDFTTELVYTLDQNECAINVKEYKNHSGSNAWELYTETTSTYLDNLWYRPTKSLCTAARKSNKEGPLSITSEWQYNADKKVTLFKRYPGQEETEDINYLEYVTYEY